MATKAERFRAREERSGEKKAKAPKRPRRDLVVDTSKPGVSASDRKVSPRASAERNASTRAGEKDSAVVLEDSAGKPSRKSTRRSKGGAKTTSNLKRRQTRRVTSPAARAGRAKSTRKASAMAKAKRKTSTPKR